MPVFNLLEQLAFYGSYHHNKWNQVIHIFFVPAIVWSAAVWMAYTGPLVPYDLRLYLGALPEQLARYAVLNLAAFCLAAYTLYYLTLEFFAGLTWGIFLGVPIWLSATAFRQLVPCAWAWALGVHVLSWIAQVWVGHIVCEKRKPALLDSFFQSLILAPLFVWVEVLFMLNYRPGLQRQLEQRVTANLAAMRAEQPAADSSKEALLGTATRPASVQ
ncbi:hypothetical protein WJX72_011978 [[Myrmecia] bisecta]|uniref:DUF962 domain-containing protein n=1 Tax=[Myrmecia] bisecta TaxID=41462 RepID=A0AAW1RAA2_9CHLO